MKLPFAVHLPVASLLCCAPASAQCGALLFDGTNDRATVIDTQNDFDLESEMTIEVWARIDTFDDFHGILGSPTLGWAMYTQFTGLGFHVGTPSTTRSTVVFGALMGTWTHYAATYDGSTIELFVNGISVAKSTPWPEAPTTDVDAVVFGRSPFFGLSFDGALDEARIWNLVRTPAEISATYMTPLVGNEPGLVGYYKFNETDGEAILDSSSRANHGWLGVTASVDGNEPTRIPNGLPFDTCAGADIGTSYCGPAAPNSTGVGGVLIASGSPIAAANNLSLTADQLPPGEFGYFLAGQTQGFATPPGSQGNICLSGNIGRLNDVTQIIQGPTGSATVDLTAIPVNPVQSVLPGETWNFQCWFRDNNPGLTNNFTDGLMITFQ